MTYLEPTANYFRRHQDQWISAVDLTKVAGLLAWRSRVSELRTKLGMQITNKQERDRSGKVRSF